MAEWGLLIHCFVVVAITYWVSRMFDETRKVIIAWVIAGLIITIGLGVYGASKVGNFESSWNKRYQIDDNP